MSKIFNALPDTLFSVLASPNRQLHARILMRLMHVFFEDLLADEPTKEQVIAEIEREILQNVIDNPDNEVDLENKEPAQNRIYNTLKRAGWFEETRDRYKIKVEMSPSVHFMLGNLLKLFDGLDMSYGGKVLEILSNLRPVREDPVLNCQGISNAAKQAREFARHLKGLTASLRLIEQELIEQADFKTVVQTFFGEFIDKLLVQDFKKLMTANNPFRFRRDIVHLSEDIRSDETLLAQISQSYVEQGVCSSKEIAQDRIENDLLSILKIFNSVDGALERINERQNRIAQRFKNAILYTNSEYKQSGYFAQALEQLGKVNNDDFQTEIKTLLNVQYLSPNSLYTVKIKRPVLENVFVRIKAKDPAIDRFNRAKNDYTSAVRMTPTKIAEYINSQMGSYTCIEDKDFSLKTPADLVAFSSLRSLEFVGNGLLRKQFKVEHLTGLFEHEWVVCKRFQIKRINL